MKFDRSFLIGIFMGLSLITFAQSRTISGTILDSETNSGLPGVTIAIKGAGQMSWAILAYRHPAVMFY